MIRYCDVEYFAADHELEEDTVSFAIFAIAKHQLCRRQSTMMRTRYMRPLHHRIGRRE